GRWISLIHIDDLVSAFAHAVTLPGRRAYIAADDSPTTYSRLFLQFAREPEPAPRGGQPMTALPSFKVSNRRLRLHGWQPVHSDVFSAMQRTLHQIVTGGQL